MREFLMLIFFFLTSVPLIRDNVSTNQSTLVYRSLS